MLSESKNYNFISDRELHITAAMFRERFYSYLSVVLLSLVVTVTPLFASANCTGDLAGGMPGFETRQKILQSVEVSLMPYEKTPVFLSVAIRYLASRTDLTGAEKAASWVQFVGDIDEIIKPYQVFNVPFRGSDGAFGFQGHGGITLVFSPEGRVYRGNMIPTWRDEIWPADYSNLNERLPDEKVPK